MKARAFTGTLLLMVLALSANLTFSQTPQGFSYQAVIRDGNGNPIANQSVSLKVTLQNISGTPYFTENKTITTSSLGVINHTVGEGTATFGSFTSIPWSSGDIFIKVEIDPAGGTNYAQMGTPSKLQSVPYALYADNTKEVASQPGASDEEPIFVVKNKDGKIVFAVYQTGVRVYVEDSQIKGARGGFAVGGLTNQNKEQQEYFRITSDSARIYVNENPSSKGARGGFAVGGLTNQNKTVVARNMLFVAHDSTRIYIDDSSSTKGARGGFAVGGLTNQNKGEKANFFNISTDTSGIINPSENRILWYPIKNAFLVGRVFIASPDSVGTNSFASGFESKAKGKYSQALGYQSVATGDFSTAIGKNAVAKKINSFAFGEGAYAKNEESYAIGKGAIASGYRSFAFGSAGIDSTGNATDVSKAIGDYSFAIGQGSVSLGKQTFALGTLDSVSGNYSIALGFRNKTIGEASVAIGFSNFAGSDLYIPFFNTFYHYPGVAIGVNSKASARESIALGYFALATGRNSISIGKNTTALGESSTAIGQYSTSSGVFSIAMGYGTTSSGKYSTSIGNGTNSKPYASLAIGQYNDTTCSPTGQSNWVLTDPVFIIGNGTFNVRSNVFTILKNGYTAVGHASPTQMLDVNGNARFRAIGSGSYFAPLNITSDGTLTTSTSDIIMKKNILPINHALEKVLSMNGVYFTWKNDESNIQRIGFIAQDMEKVLPEVVFTNPTDGLKGINYAELSAVFAMAFKEQQKQIEDLKEKNKEIDAIKAELEAIKALLKK
ncbi:MAG: tail fiber domain-containing protein [Tenuifilaceae bacterium]